MTFDIRYHEFAPGTRQISIADVRGRRRCGADCRTARQPCYSRLPMRACASCGHHNPDHLNYCFSCGRRLSEGARRAAAVPQGAAVPAGWRRPWQDVFYLVTFVRGRLATQERKRNLVEQREGARRLLEGTLFGLGQLALAETPAPQELAELADAVAQARKRREGAVADLAAAEKLQVSEDLRLGIEQSTAETDWNNCAARAGDLDRLLESLDDERREVDESLQRLRAPRPVGSAAASTGPDEGRIAALEKKRSLIEEQYRSSRERAAALRASTLAARAKFDQATASRRQAATALAANLSAHARDRGDAETSIRELTIRIGSESARLQVPRPALAAEYENVARMQAAIATHDQQMAILEGMQMQNVDRDDSRKLAMGFGVLAVLLTAIGAGAWALLH